jgi:predicted esterase
VSVLIVKKTLSNKYFSFDAIAMLPSKEEFPSIKQQWGIFTHGYTASKSDCLPWAQRLADNGAPAIFFDLPGHYLGSFNEVESFDDFKAHVQECFIDAYNFLESSLSEHGYESSCEKVILAGHSLGAMLALKALKLPFFESKDCLAICVGLGISQATDTHLFESAFYQKTLNIRRQLVSPAIDSDKVFPWIKDEKMSVDLTGKRVHLLTGQDDLVVGSGGMEALEFSLKSLDNNVTSNEPKRLPHHEPTMAASHINAFLRKELAW